MYSSRPVIVKTRVRRCTGISAGCCIGKSSELNICGPVDDSCLSEMCTPWSACCPVSADSSRLVRKRSCSKNLIYQFDPTIKKEEDCNVSQQWSDWSPCTPLNGRCGEATQYRNRSLPDCDVSNSFQEQDCIYVTMPICNKNALPEPERPQCEINEALLDQLSIMLNQNCMTYEWTAWSLCQNDCSGRRTRFSKTYHQDQPATYQYEDCAKINQCSEPAICRGHWETWSYWEETQPNIQARIRTNKCNDNDIDYRHMAPVMSYVNNNSSQPQYPENIEYKTDVAPNENSEHLPSQTGPTISLEQDQYYSQQYYTSETDQTIADVPSLADQIHYEYMREIESKQQDNSNGLPINYQTVPNTITSEYVNEIQLKINDNHEATVDLDNHDNYSIWHRHP